MHGIVRHGEGLCKRDDEDLRQWAASCPVRLPRSGSFDDPTPIGDPPTASLKAHITVKQYQFGLLDQTIQTDWEFKGDGGYRASQA
jgi:hypothetical protein